MKFYKQITKENDEIEKSENTVKNHWNCVQIFMCARVCVCGGYSCILLRVEVKVVFSACVCEDTYTVQ